MSRMGDTSAWGHPAGSPRSRLRVSASEESRAPTGPAWIGPPGPGFAPPAGMTFAPSGPDTTGSRPAIGASAAVLDARQIRSERRWHAFRSVRATVTLIIIALGLG